MAAVGVFAVAALAGCGAHQASTSGSSSSPGSSGSGAPQSASFRQCLKEHGVTAPAGGAGAGGTPAARPSGSASSSFRQAAQACGFGGHRGSAGQGA